MMRLQFVPLATECALNFVSRLRSFCLANDFCLQSMAEAAPALSSALPSFCAPSFPLSLRCSCHPTEEKGRGKAPILPATQ